MCQGPHVDVLMKRDREPHGGALRRMGSIQTAAHGLRGLQMVDPLPAGGGDRGGGSVPWLIDPAHLPARLILARALHLILR